MYAFGVLMLRLTTNLPALLDRDTSHTTFLSVHVRRALLGGTWDDFGLPLNEGGVRRLEDVTPAEWAVLPRADTSAWEGPMLASFGALALRCTEAAREARPPMADVATSLEGMLAAQGGGSGDLILEPLLTRGGECWVCGNAPRDTEFLPCHHMVTCYPCTQEHLRNSTRCLFCEKEVATAVHADRTRPPLSSSATSAAAIAGPSSRLGAVVPGPSLSTEGALVSPRSAVFFPGCTNHGA